MLFTTDADTRLSSTKIVHSFENRSNESCCWFSITGWFHVVAGSHQPIFASWLAPSRMPIIIWQSSPRFVQTLNLKIRKYGLDLRIAQSRWLNVFSGWGDGQQCLRLGPRWRVLLPWQCAVGAELEADELGQPLRAIGSPVNTNNAYDLAQDGECCSLDSVRSAPNLKRMNSVSHSEQLEGLSIQSFCCPIWIYLTCRLLEYCLIWI